MFKRSKPIAIMKILFGIHGTTHTEIAQSEIDEFQKLGFETGVCTYGNWGSANGLFKSFRLVIKNAIEIKKKVAAEKYNMVYLNTGLDYKTLLRDSITIFILRRYSKKNKIVLKIHGAQNRFIFSKTNLFKKYVFKKANLLLVLSSEERKSFLSIGLPPNKVQVTANVIDKSLYTTDPGFKAKFGLAKNIQILLFVGRFIKPKGIIDLIEACKLLKNSTADFKLFCLGDGPLVNEAKALIDAYQLTNNMHFAGHISESEARHFYANCDILVLPTYHEEGFPMAVFQAVGAGKPVITTKIRAAADYLVANENCLWVEAKNPGQIASQILILMNDKPLQDKMKKNNLVLAEKFTPEKIVGNIIEYFKFM